MEATDTDITIEDGAGIEEPEMDSATGGCIARRGAKEPSAVSNASLELSVEPVEEPGAELDVSEADEYVVGLETCKGTRKACKP